MESNILFIDQKNIFVFTLHSSFLIFQLDRFYGKGSRTPFPVYIISQYSICDFYLIWC